ncbi:hypothetical protein SCHPADRAFT_383659 [Schizopora paradoxa]|uniref:Uncharacterized protein n=1 Tax=Schizopora paradoxa TaxID=27342 RepID=A0A0H2RND5_9AGAM|nr:hypothetical protein SCHPADRAFT_383659 [Schizopora paradoxa]
MISIDNPTNKCTPYIISAIFSLDGPTRASRQYRLGIHDKNLNSFVEYSRTRTSELRSVSFEMESFDLAGRLLGLHVAFQAWSMNERLHMMIQATDVWTDDDVKSYLEEFSENILLIATSKSSSRVQVPSPINSFLMKHLCCTSA